MTAIHAEPSRPFRRIVHRLTLGAVVLFAALPAAIAVGCSDPPEMGPPANPCVGGVMLGGRCQAKCDPEKCAAGNVCVNNECKLVCTTHTDCVLPYQACRPATADDAVEGEALLAWMAGATGVCVDIGRVPVPGKRSFGDGCPNGSECDGFACPNGLPCDPDACHDGAAPHPELCQRDDAACGDAERCNIGTCEGTGAPCVFRDCAPEECTPMVCLGAGEGDPKAYCTHHDCQQDADCPDGYRCGVTRDAHDICGPTCDGDRCSDNGAACDVDGDCQKGNNFFCGETDEPCIDPASFTANGGSYFEGSICLLRRTCLKRESCSPCVTSQDCSLDKEQVCAPFGDGNVCARFCATEADCVGDEGCWPSFASCELDPQLPCPSVGCPPRPCIDGRCVVPPGSSETGAACESDADCPPQSCMPRSVCLPREGFCRTPGGGFCRHCVDDTDCGEVGSTQGCAQVTDGQYACIDLSYEAVCPGGGDSECPTAPSGAHGECLNEAEQVSSSDWIYEHCYFPFDNSSSRFTCWP